MIETPRDNGRGELQVRICQAASSGVSIYYLLRGQIQALVSAGCDVRALSGRDEYSIKAVNAGISLDIAPMVRELSLWRDFAALLWLVRYFKRNRFDIVHSHTPKAGLIVPLAARIAGVPCVLHTVHGFLFHDRMRKPRWLAGWLAEKFTSLWVDGLLFQSQEDCDNAPRLHILPNNCCFYIGNGVEVNHYLPADGDARLHARALLNIEVDEFVVGFAGRLVKEKGIEDLLRCAERFISGKKNIRVVVVGPLEERVQSDSLKTADLEYWREKLPVMFLGLRDDVHSLYPAMDVFVLPSYREGLPRVLIEATLAGVPVIATNIRGNREVVEHEVNGLLCVPGDVDGLLDALEYVYAHPLIARERATKAQQNSLLKFDEKNVAGRIVAVYRHFVRAEVGARLKEKLENASQRSV
ncbi:MAG: glycosyltransferase family 4 protein [Terracidiphilus sp.]|jgi:glycosyltransferase involved in cell wall biosynthesis